MNDKYSNVKLKVTDIEFTRHEFDLITSVIVTMMHRAIHDLITPEIKLTPAEEDAAKEVIITGARVVNKIRNIIETAKDVYDTPKANRN